MATVPVQFGGTMPPGGFGPVPLPPQMLAGLPPGSQAMMFTMPLDMALAGSMGG